MLEKFIEHAIDRPMSDTALETKFRNMADGTLEESQVDRLVDSCWNVRAYDDVGSLAKASALI